ANKVVAWNCPPETVVQITEASGLEVERTTTDAHGMGSLTFTPHKNASYFLRIMNDKTKIVSLKIEDEGCSLRLVLGRREEPIKILAASPPGSPLRAQQLVIIVTAGGKVYHSVAFVQGEKELVELQMPRMDLPEGITHVSLLDQDGNLLASRDLYSAQRDPIHAKVDVNNNFFQVRDIVKLQVLLTDSAGRPVAGEFSVNVLNDGLFDGEKRNSFPDGLTIMPGDRNFAIDRSDPNWMASLDNFLISSTKAVPWDEILSSDIRKPRLALSSFIQKTGRAYFADTGKPMPDGTDVLFYLQRSRMRYQARVDNGKVWLALPDLQGSDELLYVAETSYYQDGIKHGKEIPDLRIDWEEESPQLPSATASKESEHPDRYASFVQKKKLIERSFGFYTSDAIRLNGKNLDGAKDFEREIGGPDVTVDVQKYVVFPTMIELIREVIPSLQYRKEGGKNRVLINLPEALWEMKTGNPLYVIDGIATKNTEFFLSLKPADLVTLKIVNNLQKLNRFGFMGKNGVVMIQTQKGDVREPLDGSKLIEGLNMPISSSIPGHSDARFARRPDFRSTIYWNPTIETDSAGKASIEFSCSDDIGKLSICIEGFATGGKPFSSTKEIEVVLSSEKK
ncbi:MAG TPA: hypothetical protein VKQ08_11755, partial [Cyclobacteriaceae bacterium]|nr:hypothetical protein [Cyclobacteriaceae bacterium]